MRYTSDSSQSTLAPLRAIHAPHPPVSPPHTVVPVTLSPTLCKSQAQNKRGPPALTPKPNTVAAALPYNLHLTPTQKPPKTSTRPPPYSSHPQPEIYRVCFVPHINGAQQSKARTHAPHHSLSCVLTRPFALVILMSSCSARSYVYHSLWVLSTKFCKDI